MVPLLPHGCGSCTFPLAAEMSCHLAPHRLSMRLAAKTQWM